MGGGGELSKVDDIDENWYLHYLNETSDRYNDWDVVIEYLL